MSTTSKLIIPKTLLLPSVPNGRRRALRYVEVDALCPVQKFMSEGDVEAPDLVFNFGSAWPTANMFCKRTFLIQENTMQTMKWKPTDLTLTLAWNADGVYKPDSNTGWEGPIDWYCPGY